MEEFLSSKSILSDKFPRHSRSKESKVIEGEKVDVQLVRETRLEQK